MSAVDPRLDRMPSFDPRSRNYPIRALIDPLRTYPRRSYTWRVGAWLDQGNEGACVGFGWSHDLVALPAPVKDITNEWARQLYYECRRNDEWPGEDYEGTSVIAGAKVLKARGFYGQYRWGFGEEDLAITIGYHGPAILGLNWRAGMMNPDTEGFIRPTGQVVGGHCILCYGYNARMKLYKLWNSWGAGWGVHGTCLVTQEDMDALLHDQGEACIPVDRHRIAVPTGTR